VKYCRVLSGLHWRRSSIRSAWSLLAIRSSRSKQPRLRVA